MFTWRGSWEGSVTAEWTHLGTADLGELLPASASLDHRTELVLETTVDDARRVRANPQ